MASLSIMQITEISYGITINLGNYESARVDITARVDEDDIPGNVLEDLKEFCREQEKRITNK